MSILRVVLSIVVLWLPSAAAFASVAGRFEDSIVRLTVSKQSVDLLSPWQYEAVAQQTYQGVVVGPGQILTTAFAVADATFIEMQRFGSSRRIELQPSFVDYEVNLAVLQASEGDLRGLRPFALGADTEVGERVDILKARDSYQLTKLSANLQDVSIFNAVTSSYTLASYLFKVQQSGLGWAEAVVQDGKLVALTSGQDQSFVHAIPSSIIKHFLQDTHTEQAYRGFPAMGVQLSPLVSPDVRKLLKADGLEHGVRVSRVMADSGFRGKLQEDDVLLEVDGVEISEHGFYTHPKWGKIHLKYLLNQRYGGDLLKVKVLRAGQELMMEAVLSRFNSNRAPVPTYNRAGKEPHLIFGGLVLQELTRPFLTKWGKDWRNVAPYEFLFVLAAENDPVDEPNQRAIILNRVLADEFNRGYERIRYELVESVNGRTVKNLDDLKGVLKSHPISREGRRYAVVRLARGGGEIILAYEGLQAAHQRMAREYKINDPASFFAD